MFNSFFELKENPFNITADPSFFYSSQKHIDAFNHLKFGIQSRKGIMVLTGEVGTGKTTICRKLINELDSTIHTAFILHPSFTDIQLLKLIIHDFGITCHSTDKLEILDVFNQFLIEQSNLKNNVVLLIDEAQNLGVQELEQIRLLSNLETEKQKLLQIILVGQPELFDKLHLHELRQLNQRIAIRYHIQPLTYSEVSDYVYHRLIIAGSRGSICFTEKALQALTEQSQGIPRLINIISERAMLAAFVEESFEINERMINLAAYEIR